MLVTVRFGYKIGLFVTNIRKLLPTIKWSVRIRYFVRDLGFGTRILGPISVQIWTWFGFISWNLESEADKNGRTKIWTMDRAGSMLGMVRFEIFDFRYDTFLFYELWNRKSFADYTFLADPSFYSPMKVLLSAHKECYLLKLLFQIQKMDNQCPPRDSRFILAKYDPFA